MDLFNPIYRHHYVNLSFQSKGSDCFRDYTFGEHFLDHRKVKLMWWPSKYKLFPTISIYCIFSMGEVDFVHRLMITVTLTSYSGQSSQQHLYFKFFLLFSLITIGFGHFIPIQIIFQKTIIGKYRKKHLRLT